MQTTTQAIESAQGALGRAREAFLRGDLIAARRFLRFAANESEDASHALNEKISAQPLTGDTRIRYDTEQ